MPTLGFFFFDKLAKNDLPFDTRTVGLLEEELKELYVGSWASGQC